MRVVGDENQPADDAAQQVEDEKAQPAERPLDVVAEHPQEDHVADDVPDVGMEELVGDERQRTAGTHPRAGMSPIRAAGVRL